MLNTIWFHKFPEGRFSNAAFQLVFARYLEKLGYNVIFGNVNSPNDYSLPWDLFNITANSISYSSKHELFLGEDRQFGPSESIRAINLHFVRYPNSVLCINGYFQFDTSQIKSDPYYYMAFVETLGLVRERGNPFQIMLKKYYDMIKSSYLVTIHVRRGDYNDFTNLEGWFSKVFYLLDLDNVICKLENYLKKNRIQNHLIYIATDDLEYCRNYFKMKGIKIVTSKDYIRDSDDNSLIIDLAAIAAANMTIASNSTVSILGSMINDQGKVFWRQDANGDLISFDPWGTPVLYGPVLNNYSLY